MYKYKLMLIKNIFIKIIRAYEANQPKKFVLFFFGLKRFFFRRFIFFNFRSWIIFDNI